jgi:signal transduction histidine kinase/ActR/RegA family two-component response regulator
VDRPPARAQNGLHRRPGWWRLSASATGMLVGASTSTVMALIDLLNGPRLVTVAAMMLGPLLAASFSPWRSVLALSIAVMVLGVANGWWNETYGAWSHSYRLTLLAVGCSAAVAAARAREAREQKVNALSEVALNSERGVALCSTDGVVEWVNDAFCHLTGLSRETSIGPVLWDLVGPYEESDIQGMVSAPTLLERSASIGDQVFDVELKPVFGPTGVISLIATYVDVTARHLIEANLRATSERAQEASEAKARFLATMSHEIRTPLASVLGFTELLAATDLDERQAELARSAHVSGQLLLELVNDILLYSRVDAGEIQLDPTPFSLAEVFRRVNELLSIQADELGVHLSWHVDQRIPEFVVGDQSRLVQVLVNLIGNGVKFSPGGTVHTSASPDSPGWVCIEVSDDGLGIPEHRLSAVFSPFTQVDGSVSRRHEGTGLGLAICAGLVEAMGGTISLSSAERVGTTAVVCLPFEGALEYRQGPDPGSSRTPSCRLRILVAEDDSSNQKVVALFLANFDLEVEFVADGAAAVEAVSSGVFDVVLLDLHMPLIGGVDAAERIRASLTPEQRPFLVAATADIAVAGPDWLDTTGFDSRLVKPYTLESLGSVLLEAEAFLDRRR